MVRRVVIHAAHFHIHVSAKALSGASDEIGILGVRRSIFAAVASPATTERRCGDEVVQVYKCEIRN